MQSTACIFIKQLTVRFKIRNQRYPMRRALVRLPQCIQLQPHTAQVQLIPQIAQHHNQLRIHVRPTKAKRLHAQLVKLTIPPFLWPLMAKHRPHAVHALRAIVSDIRLNRRPHHTRCKLRAQGQIIAIETVDERKHFLFHHIGELADPPRKQCCFFQNRRTHIAIAITFQPAT